MSCNNFPQTTFVGSAVYKKVPHMALAHGAQECNLLLLYHKN